MTDTEREFLKAVDGDAGYQYECLCKSEAVNSVHTSYCAVYNNRKREEFGRPDCPPMNIGRIFGAIGDGLLEGFIDNPAYCIVRDGRCSRHSLVSKADLLDAVETLKAATSCATCKMPFEVRWVPTCQCS